MSTGHKKPNKAAKIIVSEDGPYIVSGAIPLSKQIIATDAQGGSESWEQGRVYGVEETYSLCRCGQSRTKPFCDASHLKHHFDGTETASRRPYIEQAEALDGPSLVLSDAQGLCAFARFCDTHGQIWNQVRHTADPNRREAFVQQAGQCPSGRLVAWDKKTGEALL